MEFAGIIQYQLDKAEEIIDDLPGMIARIVTASAYSKSSVPSSSPARTLAILETLPESEISFRSAMNALRGILSSQACFVREEVWPRSRRGFLEEIQAKPTRFKVRRGGIQRKRMCDLTSTDNIAITHGITWISVLTTQDVGGIEQ